MPDLFEGIKMYEINSRPHNCPFHDNTSYQIVLDKENSVLYDEQLDIKRQLIQDKKFLDESNRFKFNALITIFKPLKTQKGKHFVTSIVELKKDWSKEEQYEFVYYQTTYCIKNRENETCNDGCLHLSHQEMKEHFQKIGSISLPLLCEAQKHNFEIFKDCQDFEDKMKKWEDCKPDSVC